MRALRSGALLFRKDLRVLVRSRGLLAVLIGYPIVIAILLAIALSGGDRRPGVAFVNLDAASGRTVQVGDERLSVDDYATRLEDDVDLVRLDPAQAEEGAQDGGSDDEEAGDQERPAGARARGPSRRGA